MSAVANGENGTQYDQHGRDTRRYDSRQWETTCKIFSLMMHSTHFIYVYMVATTSRITVLLPISRKVYFPTERIVHTAAFLVTRNSSIGDPATRVKHILTKFGVVVPTVSY